MNWACNLVPPEGYESRAIDSSIIYYKIYGVMNETEAIEQCENDSDQFGIDFTLPSHDDKD